MPNVALASLRSLAREALIRAGTKSEAAAETATALVHSDASGIASHGVSRIPLYVAHLRHGRVDGAAVATIVGGKGAVRIVDAGNGFAFPACRLAVAECIPLAREFGIGVSAVIHSNHFGAAAYPLDAAARDGLIGIALGNSPGAIAAWGGKTPLFGTNPIAAVFPRRHAAPLSIDLSLSKVARGKLLVAAQKGEPIPPDWALDPDGDPTTDPVQGLQGSMLPAGGIKGAMLALLVELLIGAVVGAGFAFEADSFFAETGNAANLGQMFLLLDPAAFSGSDAYLERVETLVAAVLSDARTRLPGTRRKINRDAAYTDGVVIPERLFSQLLTLAGRTPDTQPSEEQR